MARFVQPLPPLVARAATLLDTDSTFSFIAIVITVLVSIRLVSGFVRLVGLW
jgi:hypothetical protein